MEVHEYLKQERQNKKITCSSLAKSIGLSQSYLSAIENGLKPIVNKKMNVVCEYINVLSNSEIEYDHHAQIIYEISKGEINIKRKNIKRTFERTENKNDLIYIDPKNEIVKNHLPIPINDLQYHLYENMNAKFYGNEKLTREDKEFIVCVIEKYLESKR